MEWIIIVVVILFMFVNVKGKVQNREKRRNRLERSPQPVSVYAPGTSEAFYQVRAMHASSEGEGRQGLSREGEAIQSDRDGCIGGSIMHEAHEGTAFGSGGYAPIKIIYAPDEQQTAPANRPGNRSKLSATQMRNAVIMAEILAKPVSCRRR